MGLFDIFSDEPAERAAEKRIAGINRGFQSATDAINAGLTRATDLYGRALVPFQQLYDTGKAGLDAYGDAFGLNGAEGNARARSGFQASPGYNFALDQGLAAIDRGAAARGTLSSGGTRASEQAYGANLANQEWSNYLNRFSPLATLAGSSAQGIASANQGLGNLNATAGGQLADYGWKQGTGVGDAQAAADLAAYNASANMWGAIFNGANLGAKLLGYGGK